MKKKERNTSVRIVLDDLEERNGIRRRQEVDDGVKLLLDVCSSFVQCGVRRLEFGESSEVN